MEIEIRLYLGDEVVRSLLAPERRPPPLLDRGLASGGGPSSAPVTMTSTDRLLSVDSRHFGRSL